MIGRAIFTVELTIAGEMSWCIATSERLREAGGPEAKAERVDRDRSELVLTWPELEAEGAWRAMQLAVDRGMEIVPEIATSVDMMVEAVVQRPEHDPRPPLPEWAEDT